jgi:hypothetical protein
MARAVHVAPAWVWASTDPYSDPEIPMYSDVGGEGTGLGDGGTGVGCGLGDGDGLGVATGDEDALGVSVPVDGAQPTTGRTRTEAVSNQRRLVFLLMPSSSECALGFPSG